MTTRKEKGITRRRLMQGAAMVGAAAAFAPRYSLADDGNTLRVRVYSDIQNLDPGFRVAEPDSRGHGLHLRPHGPVQAECGQLGGGAAGGEDPEAARRDPCRLRAQSRHHVFRRLWRDDRRRRQILLRAHRRSQDGGGLSRRLGLAEPGHRQGQVFRHHRAEGGLRAALDQHAPDRERHHPAAEGL